MMAMVRFLAALMLVPGGTMAASPAVAAFGRTPDVVLAGTIHDTDRATTRDVAFDVPPGTAQVRVAFEYDGRDRGVTMTLGIRDPDRERGWGGGTKRTFAVAESHASAGFLAGPIPPGRWRLMMTVPAIRRDDAAPWRARIWFSRSTDLDEVAFADAPLDTREGWYRGDLHTHSGYSDARCTSLGGREAPCPAEFTVAAASANALDFLALTDHNTTSHFTALAALQPYYDTLLLLPGRELTTRFGHANLVGPMAPMETEIGRPGAETLNALLHAAHATGGFLTVNHPSRPTGEDCLGCGWAPTDTDWSQVDAIEAVNGGTTQETPGDREQAIAGQIGYWEDLLNRGYRLVGIAGSDNHDAIQQRGGSPIGQQAPVGSVATVVRAANLSQGAVLAGLRSGRVFIDLGEGRGRVIDLSVQRRGRRAVMGGTLPGQTGPGQTGAMTGRVHVEGVAGGKVELVVDGRTVPLGNGAIPGATADLAFTLAAEQVTRWVRANVRRPDGRLWLVGNPVWIGGR